MKFIETTLWQHGKERCVTFSYDDGRIEDKRLVELFNKYGLKGTFHLNNPGFEEHFPQFLKEPKFVAPVSMKLFMRAMKYPVTLLSTPFFITRRMNISAVR